MTIHDELIPVKLPASFVFRVSEFIADLPFERVEDFLIYITEDLMTEENSEGMIEDEAIVKQRLRDLGYL